MITVTLQVLDVLRDERPPVLLVLANEYHDKYLKRSFTWRFPLPCHMQDMFERAAIQCHPNRIWWQETYLIDDEYGLFY